MEEDIEPEVHNPLYFSSQQPPPPPNEVQIPADAYLVNLTTAAVPHCTSGPPSLRSSLVVTSSEPLSYADAVRPLPFGHSAEPTAAQPRTAIRYSVPDYLPTVDQHPAPPHPTADIPVLVSTVSAPRTQAR